MKLFNLRCKILAVSGYQHWSVEAETKEDALRLFNDGEADFEHEEMEVVEVSKPEITDII